MKARVLFTDAQKIGSERGKFDRAQLELNELNDFLTEHKIGPLTKEMVGLFLRNPQEALRAIYKAKIPEVNEHTGLRNNRDRMLDEMQLPTAPSVDNFPFAHQVKDTLYVFDFGKRVTLNPERFGDYLNGFCYVTSDPEIIQAYDDFMELAKQLTKLNNKLHFIPFNATTGINREYKLGDTLSLTTRGFELQQKGFMQAVNLLRR